MPHRDRPAAPAPGRGEKTAQARPAAAPAPAPAETGPRASGRVVTATPLERALAGVGDRWALLIIDALLDGPRRYGELADAVGGIAPNILADRLRRLAHDGLVVGEPYQERPRRLAYRLSADGAALAGALAQLGAWAARREGLPAPHYHALCGTELELRPWCPTCQQAVGADDADELDRL